MEEKKFQFFMPEVNTQEIQAACGGSAGSFGGTAYMKTEGTPAKAGVPLMREEKIAA